MSESFTLPLGGNQSGRRNFTDEQQKYNLGKLYELLKKKQGGTGANQYTKVQSVQNEHSAKTAETLATENSVSKITVIRAARYAAAIDAIAGTLRFAEYPHRNRGIHK